MWYNSTYVVSYSRQIETRMVVPRDWEEGGVGTLVLMSREFRLGKAGKF